jgi:hypothetical protein
MHGRNREANTSNCDDRQKPFLSRQGRQDKISSEFYLGALGDLAAGTF